jgi:phage shock protein C
MEKEMSNSVKRLTRSRDDKWIGGVCGGIAKYVGVDSNLIRIIVAVATLLGAGTLIIAYILAWFLIPLEDAAPSVFNGESPPAP